LHEIFTTKERRVLSTINKHLEDRTYVVGDRITLADLTLASALAIALPHTLDKEQRTNFSNRDVIKHFELIAAEPSLKELFGGIKYAEKLIQNESPK
jgi:glutathione S-transferase